MSSEWSGVDVWSSHIIASARINRVQVANPARGRLNREELYFPVRPRSRPRIWFRETGLAVPSRASLLIFHTQAESGAYLRGSSRFPRRRPFIYLKPPSVPSLSGHAIAY